MVRQARVELRYRGILLDESICLDWAAEGAFLHSEAPLPVGTQLVLRGAAGLDVPAVVASVVEPRRKPAADTPARASGMFVSCERVVTLFSSDGDDHDDVSTKAETPGALANGADLEPPRRPRVTSGEIYVRPESAVDDDEASDADVATMPGESVPSVVLADDIATAVDHDDSLLQLAQELERAEGALATAAIESALADAQGASNPAPEAASAASRSQVTEQQPVPAVASDESDADAGGAVAQREALLADRGRAYAAEEATLAAADELEADNEADVPTAPAIDAALIEQEQALAASAVAQGPGEAKGSGAALAQDSPAGEPAAEGAEQGAGKKRRKRKRKR